LKRVAEAFHIPKNRIIAFGDGPNDLEMNEYAGVGVAMENAIDELKSLASHFTVTNEENGVAKFLNEYFIIKNPIVSQITHISFHNYMVPSHTKSERHSLTFTFCHFSLFI